MKKITIAAAVLMIALAGLAVVSVNAGEKPEMKTIVGQAIELSTYTMLGGGEENIEAMQSRCAQGFPVGVVEEETGDLYICVYRHSAPASPMETANKQIAALLGKQVVVQGLSYESGEVRVIRMNIVSEY